MFTNDRVELIADPGKLGTIKLGPKVPLFAGSHPDLFDVAWDDGTVCEHARNELRKMGRVKLRHLDEAVRFFSVDDADDPRMTIRAAIVRALKHGEDDKMYDEHGVKWSQWAEALGAKVAVGDELGDTEAAYLRTILNAVRDYVQMNEYAEEINEEGEIGEDARMAVIIADFEKIFPGESA